MYFMFLFIIVSSLWSTHARSRTPLPEVLHFIRSSHINSKKTLFMIPNLCQQSGRPALSAALALSALPHVCVSLTACAFNETMVLSSNEQWVCQVFKGREDKWREGTRGCEDNGFLWWLTFHSGASKKVWLSYCVFTDSPVNRGPGTGLVCGTEGNKHNMSNLYLECRRVWVYQKFHVCKQRVTHTPFSSLKNRALFTKMQPAWRRVSQLARWRTGHSVCQVGSLASCHAAVTHLSPEASGTQLVCCVRVCVCAHVSTIGAPCCCSIILSDIMAAVWMPPTQRLCSSLPLAGATLKWCFHQ